MATKKALTLVSGRIKEVTPASDTFLISGLDNSAGTLTMAATDVSLLSGANLTGSGGSVLSAFDSIEGITSANLLDKSAAETVAGVWTYQRSSGDGAVLIAKERSGQGLSTTIFEVQDSTGSVLMSVDNDGDLVVQGTQTFVGGTTFDGSTTFGDATSDTVTFTARVATGTDLIPQSDSSSEFGADTLRWLIVHTDQLGGILYADTKATLLKNAAAANADLTFTAKLTGVTGNDIRVKMTSGVAESISVVSNDIDVTYNASTSTANSLKTLIDGDAGAAALVSVSVEGTGLGVWVAGDASAFENLTSGADSFGETGEDVDFLGTITAAEGATVTSGGLTVSAGGITSTGAHTLNLTDNTADVLDVQEGTNNYLNINTTNASEAIQFGNATTNPAYSFLGSGGVTVNAGGLTITAGGATVTAGGLTVDAGGITATGTYDINLTDNTANAFDVEEGTNEYISIDTTNASELITLGNATTNPGVTFAGTGDIVAANGTLDVPSGTSMKIGGLALSANWTQANVDELTALIIATDITGAEAETLTDGSNADALHTHDFDPQDTDWTTTATANGDLVFADTTGDKVSGKAVADGVTAGKELVAGVQTAASTVAYSGAVPVTGDDVAVPARGTLVFLSDATAGRWTVTAPSGAGDFVAPVGIVVDTTGYAQGSTAIIDLNIQDAIELT